MSLDTNPAASASPVFAEWIPVTGEDPLRQGDILESVDIGASMWKRHLVVITADCDFAFAKHQGRVTCVPLLSKDEYVAEFQLPVVRKQLADKRVRELAGVLGEINGPKISPERLRRWPSERAPFEILQELKVPAKHAERVLHALEAIRLIDQEAGGIDDAVANLILSRQCSTNPPKHETAVKETTDKILQPFRNPPGDTMFISTIARNQEDGYFAYLRHLEQAWEPQIATTYGRGDYTYRRISRLQDRYIHALVLRFATVFLAVGLPSEYEEIRDLHATTLGERFE